MTLTLPRCLCRIPLDQFIQTPSTGVWPPSWIISPAPIQLQSHWAGLKKIRSLMLPFRTLPPYPLMPPSPAINLCFAIAGVTFNLLLPFLDPVWRSPLLWPRFLLSDVRHILWSVWINCDGLWVLVGGHRRWPGTPAPWTRLKSILNSWALHLPE